WWWRGGRMIPDSSKSSRGGDGVCTSRGAGLGWLFRLPRARLRSAKSAQRKALAAIWRAGRLVQRQRTYGVYGGPAKALTAGPTAEGWRPAAGTDLEPLFADRAARSFTP